MIGESQEPVGASVGGGSGSNKTPTLEEYGTNLTQQAEEVRCAVSPSEPGYACLPLSQVDRRVTWSVC